MLLFKIVTALNLTEVQLHIKTFYIIF